MKKALLYIAVVAAVAMTGCQKFDTPAPYTPATDADITADGYTFISISDLKQQYFYNDTPNPGTTVKGVKITDKIAIKGKVVSTDETGNIYRSLYIQSVDANNKLTTGAIEIKVGKSSMYNTYKFGQIVYVKVDGLILGNYRNMLSLGGASVGTDAAKYSNGYIDILSTINAKVIRGEYVGITDAEVMTFTSADIATIYGSANDKPYLGCLVQLNGLTSHWGSDIKVGGYSGNYYPSYYDSDQSIYNAQYPEGEETLGYSKDNKSYYGSALFIFDSSTPFIVRTSGYSKFALEPVPADGKTVNLRAIYGVYGTTYQLTINRSQDLVTVN